MPSRSPKRGQPRDSDPDSPYEARFGDLDELGTDLARIAIRIRGDRDQIAGVARTDAGYGGDAHESVLRCCSGRIIVRADEEMRRLIALGG